MRMMDRLELPLDSYSVKGLFQDCKEHKIKIPEQSLIKDFTVKALSPSKSRKLQAVALQVAKARNTCRIHLDIIYWRNNKD